MSRRGLKGFLTVLGVLTLCRHYACSGKTAHGSAEEGKLEIQSPGDALPPQQSAQVSAECNLYPYDPYLPKRLRKLAESGALHLAKYELEFPEYDVVPLRLKGNTTYHYKTNVWYRVFSAHGQRLLTMAFNYDALSISLLGFGVKTFRVPVVDGPPKCFVALTEAGQMDSVLRLLMRDLETDDKVAKDELIPWDANKHSVCHQVIEDDDGSARIVFRCCTSAVAPPTDRTRCSKVERDDVIDALYIILGLLKIAFVLFGPLVLQRMMFEGSTKKTSYLVPIAEEAGLHKTILVKKVRGVDDESASSGYGRRKDMKQFTRFRKLVKTIPSEAIVPVRFNRLDILVDHKELMTEDGVPVGLFRFVYETFIRCGITRVEPLKSCCEESIFGSWSPRFLWLKLRKRCDCNRGCRDSCSWSSLFNLIGVVVLILVIPFPYYIRLGVFYAFEEDEIKDRQEAIDRLNLDYIVDHNIFQWLTPTHAGLVGVYITYVASLLLLSALRVCDSSKIDGIARACVTDMRHIRQSECLRMLCAHVLLPFEKFGVFGVAVAALYWPLVLPLCLLIAVFYCVPLLYLAGRLLINYRPGCCRRKPLPTPGGRSNKSLSKGVTSFDSCFFLDSISPDSRPYSSVSSVGVDPSVTANQEAGRKTRQRNVRVYRQRLASAFGTFLVGLLMLLGVCSVLVMYAEAFGFIVEVCVLTSLGAVVNSDRSVQYVILAFWGVVYAVASCRLSYAGYTRLSRQLFHFIRTRLNDGIQAASPLRYEKRRNTAFKFLTIAEAVQLKAQDQASVWQDDSDTPATTAGVGRSALAATTSGRLDGGAVSNDRGVGAVVAPDDSIEYRDNRLHWSIHSLVLFVDKNDVSRIPLDFFWEICKLDMPGSPGPVHKAALRATGCILCSLVFLSLLSIVVLSFGNMYEVATPNQMILMLVSGAVPLIIFLVVYGFNLPHGSCINQYSLHGKVQRVIVDYCQSWPVYDLSFTRGGRAAGPGGASREDNHPLMMSCRHQVHGLRTSDGDDPDCCHRQGCRQQRMWPEDQTTELKSIANAGGRGAAVAGARCGEPPVQVDLLITVKDEQEEDNIRSEPVSLGSGMSINSNGGRGGPDRTSPDDNPPVTPSTGHCTQSATTGCVTNQPTNATRSRMTESAEALQGETGSAFALRKQSSASTLPVHNHVTSTETQADVVVDMTDDVVFVKKIGFASPRNTVSMRSLPSYKHRSCESTSESAL